MAKEAKLETWVQWYNNHVSRWRLGRPGRHLRISQDLCPWISVSKPKAQGLYMWERNPYYWKVDTEGNQLPYIDTMRFDYSANTETTKLKTRPGRSRHPRPARS